MQDTAQELAFADDTIEEIISDQREIETMTKLAKIKKEAAIQKIDSWLAEGVEVLQKRIDEKKAMIQPIIERQLEGKKKKSIKLPSGTVGFKKSDAKFTIDGEKVDGKSEQLLELVKEHSLNEYIVVKESVDWKGLKKTLKVVSDGLVVTEDGEIMRNLEAEPEVDVFYVKGN